ncbi:MAG: hypothetical protein KME45_03150 [Stenomitos rutilans HA7619-LM2]|jgi:hypothetical protein|nr:hypothetical protein [Stenomitos rutilans HA7619-LM2]MBW4469382.1 hypothetical protein [Stenomitos rutilans HA7619-LM2]
MQATLNHYNVRHQLIVTLASGYVALKLVYASVKPYAVRFWQLVSSEEAQRCYEFLILSVIALAWMSAFAAVWLGNRTREQFDQCIDWRDRFIASHLEHPSEFLVGNEIAEEGCALLVELFAQADAIMAKPIYADAPVKRRHRKAKGFQPVSVH